MPRILTAALLLLAASTAATVVHRPGRTPVQQNSEYPFPHYSQCDPRWANDTMGTKGNGERSTICGEGCAMTSVSMALAGLGVRTVDGALVNPRSLNEWLLRNGGYYCAAGDCNNLNLTAPERFNRSMTLIGEDPKPSFEEMVHNIKAGSVIYIAHVRDKTHFVLLQWPATDGTKGFVVHDPNFPTTVYPYTNISDVIMFHVDKYPMYKQCDPRWGNVVMGANKDTICQVGCLMTSITMGMAGTGIRVDGEHAIPPATNRFLQAHNGFVGNSSALSEVVIAKINPQRIQWTAAGFHLKNDIPFSTIVQFLNLDVPRIVIANVMHGEHFVLVTGYRDDGDTLVINDPGFDRDTYSYSGDVVGWRIFEME